MTKLLRSLVAALILSAFPFAAQAAEPENTLVISLKDGDVTIALRPDIAPGHVERIKALVRKGAYDGVVFHRVIDGFMAQTGDVQFGNSAKNYNPGQAGMGGSDMPDLKAEFSMKPSITRWNTTPS